MSRSNLHRTAARLLALALLGGLALVAPSEAVAQGKKSDSVVKVSATGDKIGPDGKQTITVTLTMTGKWYVYANPVGVEDLADVQTVVTVNRKPKPVSVKVSYPTPVTVKDKVVGDYKVYKEKAVIRAIVQRARGDTGPIDVSVRFQSCNGSVCLLPPRSRCRCRDCDPTIVSRRSSELPRNDHLPLTQGRTSMLRAMSGPLAVGLLALALVSLPAAAPPAAKAKRANRLARESSPYLLQHAHNPVDWYPWGPEAFAKAKKEKKLVFLSIGYSSCHWCHVMEKESFAKADVAKLLNQHFICIKVDREERPDIDQIYMTALNALGNPGGWPLSMFLTADASRSNGGTYWPREDREIDGDTYPGFKSRLAALMEIQRDKPKALADQADKVAKATAAALAAPCAAWR